MASNFNDLVPSPPAGGTNVKFQTDGSGNDSAYMTVANLLTTASVDLTAQTSNIVATPLFTPVTSGLFRVSTSIIVTTVSSPGSTLPSVTIKWTDQDNSTPQTLVVTPTNTGNSLTTGQESVVVISALTAVDITYETDSYASGGVPMQYALHLRLRKFLEV